MPSRPLVSLDPVTTTDPDAAAAAADTPPRWGLVDVVGAFLFAQVASAVGFALYASVKGVPAAELTTDLLTIGEVALLQIPLWIALLGGPLLSTWLRGNGPVRDLGWTMRVSDAWRGFGLGVLCQFVLVPLVTLPVFLLSDVTREELEEPARELTDKVDAGLGGVLLLVLVVVVMAPLAEELFYRGLLQRTLLRSLSPLVAIPVTALVFAASHGQLVQFPALAAFGVVLGVVAHRTGRQGMNTWAHVGFNATTVLVLLSQG